MEYKTKEIAEGKITRTGKKFAVVETDDQVSFIINKQEVSDFPKTRVYEVLKLNDRINFVVLKYSDDNSYNYASFKRNHPSFMNGPFTYSLKSTEKGFRNLYSHTISFIEKLNLNSKNEQQIRNKTHFKNFKTNK
ncbi:S1 RNA-binding domain-containing protein [Mycoplasmopsis gallopavonis]|uniref:30S ribosomal protein s1 n=1 Tax=Mycoplasmopsis gallopavonis TaxID=76629 RepID=A0A449B0A0_9BACT|nr:S1 RNA-binding domain-containing protein [Mycoplasmopsis gallopavonis]RIV16343.1 S1 RNA-binding domain-containing protein [Mycoplasmopsis gallopavonis]VEU73166.1 30S ribosomal protein s1 [Mycoplasmopsis gallopavonis]